MTGEATQKRILDVGCGRGKAPGAIGVDSNRDPTAADNSFDEVRALHVGLARLGKWLGVEWLVNHFVWFRRFWEMYLCFLVRGKQREFTFEVVK